MEAESKYWGLHIDYVPVPPWSMTSGKTQERIVREIYLSLADNDIIFLRAQVGSGKSAMALMLCGLLRRGIIAVPTKILQKQYADDYQGRCQIILNGGEPLKISVLQGRDNFDCTYYNDKRKASHSMLPCTQTLRGKQTRTGIALQCPFWSPVLMYPPSFDCTKKLYMNTFSSPIFICQRREGCGYYDQYLNYLSKESDVVMMNSAKWEIETWLARKPKVGIEVIDEADAWLDSLTLETTISRATFKRVRNEIIDTNAQFLIGHMERCEKQFEEIRNGLEPDRPYLLSSTEKADKMLNDLISLCTKLDTSLARNQKLKLQRLKEYSSSASFYYTAKPYSIHFFVPAPAEVLKGYIEKSAKKLIFMSATMPSQAVMQEIFGFRPKVIIGETRFPGTVYLKTTGLEQKVTWKNWPSEEFRDQYWTCIKEILRVAEKPILVNIHAKRYLPEDDDIIPSWDYIRHTQDEAMLSFLEGKLDILWTTKMDRGVDLHDELCRSVVLIKYPFPAVYSPILSSMRALLGDAAFWAYYHDIAWRECLQAIGRAVRHDKDWMQVWSPDLVVHQKMKNWKGKVVAG